MVMKATSSKTERTIVLTLVDMVLIRRSGVQCGSDEEVVKLSTGRNLRSSVEG